MSVSDKILVLNAGSSSLKAALFQGTALASPWSDSAKIDLSACSEEEIANLISTWLGSGPGITSGDGVISCVGHRIVHGGCKFVESTIIDSAVSSEIDSVSDLAPLHNPIGLKVLKVARRIFDRAKHVAVFDTAFHATIPEHAAVYPLPYEWYSWRGYRRFGFHGISHSYCSRRALKLAGIPKEGSRAVTCHLGNGCSLAAVKDGKSVDTTMGYTPLEGLMMGTRCGSVDPGLLLEVMKEGHSVEVLEEILNRKSGLAGISGVGADIRDIEKAMAEGNTRAELAHSMFVHRVVGAVASMAASAGGLDLLVFTGGIGEHSTLVRKTVCEQLAFLGVELDGGANEKVQGDGLIHSGDSGVKVAVIEAREDLEIAGECLRLIL